MSEKKVLEMKGITKIYPGVRALDGVDFIVEEGSVHALMGENGAGKININKNTNWRNWKRFRKYCIKWERS